MKGGGRNLQTQNEKGEGARTPGGPHERTTQGRRGGRRNQNTTRRPPQNPGKIGENIGGAGERTNTKKPKNLTNGGEREKTKGGRARTGAGKGQISKKYIDKE